MAPPCGGGLHSPPARCDNERLGASVNVTFKNKNCAVKTPEQAGVPALVMFLVTTIKVQIDGGSLMLTHIAV